MSEMFRSRPIEVPKASAEEIKLSIETRRGLFPEVISHDALKQAGCLSTVMALPSDFNERVQMLGNLLANMAPRNIKDDGLRFAVGQLCASLSYLLNSTSWKDGKLHDFDLLELQLKLRKFVRSND